MSRAPGFDRGYRRERSAAGASSSVQSPGTGGTPRAEQSIGYTYTFSNGGRTTPARNEGPAATNSAPIEASAGS